MHPLLVAAARLLTAQRHPHRNERADLALPEATVDNVDTASQDSFPASDPPSWTPIIGIRLADERKNENR